MATYTVHLNGGPWHDRKVALEHKRDHFHIIEPVEDIASRARKELPSESDSFFPAVETREGTYSQVRGLSGEFEWDGWVTHD